MPDTREASQRNITAIFNGIVAESRGRIKIEPTYPRWDAQPDASAGTPKLHFYLLGNPDPQYIQFSRALFDDCADQNNTEELARAENIIREKFNSLLQSSHR